MLNLILYAVLIIVLIAVIIFLIIATIRAGKEKHRFQKELEEEKERERRAAEIITEANKTKADARTGDHERDFNFMANKLHDYAQK